MDNIRTPIVAALGLLLIAGCGGGNGLEMFPIRGEVTYNGEPLDGALVTYLPTTPGEGRTATGRVQSDGSFVLTTLKSGDGAVRGKYNIVVHAYLAEERKSREEIEALGSRSPELRPAIPKRYVEPETSGLTDAVDEDHSGFKKIELQD